MGKTAILTLGLVAVLLASYWWSLQQETSVDPVLKTIVDTHMGSGGAIEDPTHELGVTDKDDIVYSVDARSLTVEYGKQQFRVDLDSDEESQTLASYLSALGLSIRDNTEGNPLLLYKGEEVKRIE
ncbi:hypothetical protein [Cohnella panacarvi]|uniref:hypothetical protein n=1 Tax=Cohnella panacarvi TaxID=400776 RepID=UPI00047D2ADA|nr:hypothetical protein [Cohnella panacarvi]